MPARCPRTTGGSFSRVSRTSARSATSPGSGAPSSPTSPPTGSSSCSTRKGAIPERQEEVFTTYLRPTDGSDAMRLGDGRALALSPDGQWALVARSAPETHLVLLPVGEGEPQRLPGGGLLYRRAVFFPDGRRILYNADDGRRHTHLRPGPRGGPPRQIGPEGMLVMLVSPDGRTVAMRYRRGGLILSGRRRGPPAGPRRAREDAPYQWSSDGKTIYLGLHERTPLTLYRFDLATGRRERWKQLSPPDMTGFLRYGSRLRARGSP